MKLRGMQSPRLGSAVLFFSLLVTLLARPARAQTQVACPDGYTPPDGAMCVQCPSDPTTYPSTDVCLYCPKGQTCDTQTSFALLGTRWLNGLATQPLMFNALATNRQINPLLPTLPLNNATFDAALNPTIHDQLADPAAQVFLKYTAECALNSSQVLRWFDNGGVSHDIKGQFGFCPSWNTQPASHDCLERVSACVLARNNGAGAHVRLSMRGQEPSRFAPFAMGRNVIPDVSEFASGDTIASFTACADPTTSGGDRDCGWKPTVVGTCNWAGQPAKVRLTTPAGTCAYFRIGGHMWGTDDAQKLAGTTACSNDATLSFTCPSTKVFSVMSAALTAQGRLPPVTYSAVQNAKFPSEQELFNVREGAFFGNLFGPNAVNPWVNVSVQNGVVILAYTPQVGSYPAGQFYRATDGSWQPLPPSTLPFDRVQLQGPIYANLYACPDEHWSTAQAYFYDRFCAVNGTGYLCAARTSANACAYVSNPASGVCHYNDGTMVSGDMDYEECAAYKNADNQDPASPDYPTCSPNGTSSCVWYRPITTFLPATCDVVGLPTVGPPHCARTDITPPTITQ